MSIDALIYFSYYANYLILSFFVKKIAQVFFIIPTQIKMLTGGFPALNPILESLLPHNS